MLTKNKIKQFALSAGAQLVGVTGAEAYAEYLGEVEGRLEATGAGLADFMITPAANIPEARDKTFFAQLADGRQTLAEAKTIIVLGVYAYDEKAVYKGTRQALRGKTARVYSYYPVVRQVAERVVGFIEERGHKAIQGQHVPLKFVADRIGMGAYGKNGVLQTEQYGSYVALRSILTDLEMAPDHSDRVSTPCEGCERCVKACPTRALYSPYKVNPRLCINPITRRDAHIEPDIRSKMQNWIHGCDICQEVCPANRKLCVRQADPRAGFDPRHHASHRHLEGLERTPKLVTLLDAKYPEILRRNAAIALGNIATAGSEALGALKEQLTGMTGGLEEYFVWAIKQIEERER